MIGFQSVTAATISGAFVFGMVLVLLESIQQLLAKRLAMSEGRVEWLLSAMNVTLIPMMFLSGLVIDKWDVKPVLIVGSVMTALAVASLALSQTAVRVLGSVLLLGVGGACLSTSSSMLMLSAFYPQNAAASQNFGNVFFALGALVSPMIAQRLLEQFQYRRGLILISVVCLLPALLAALTNFPEHQAHSADKLAVFARPLLWLAAITFLFYGPLEGSLGTWAGRYLHDLGFPVVRAERMLIGFWLAFLGSRLLAAFFEYHALTRADAQGWFIVLLALAAAVSLGNMAGARKSFSAALGLILVGFFFGPIFPTLVGILFDQFQEARGTAYGAMFALGSFGNLLLPPLIGAHARRTTVQRAMRIPMILALIVALAASVLTLYLPLARQS
jgi:fucose permease